METHREASFRHLGLEHPTGKELERKILGIKIYSPDLKTAIDVKGEGLHGYMVNRRLFGQRLLKKAKKAGATLLESTQVVEPIIKNRFVTGVLARDVETGNKFSLFGQVVVDASGFSAVLQNKLPPEIGVNANISREDVAICYREIREVKKQIAEPDFCEIYLNQKLAPGGYFWIFPEGGTKVRSIDRSIDFRAFLDLPRECEYSALTLCVVQSWLTELLNVVFYVGIQGEFGGGCMHACLRF